LGKGERLADEVADDLDDDPLPVFGQPDALPRSGCKAGCTGAGSMEKKIALLSSKWKKQ